MNTSLRTTVRALAVLLVAAAPVVPATAQAAPAATSAASATSATTGATPAACTAPRGRVWFEVSAATTGWADTTDHSPWRALPWTFTYADRGYTYTGHLDGPGAPGSPALIEAVDQAGGTHAVEQVSLDASGAVAVVDARRTSTRRYARVMVRQQVVRFTYRRHVWNTATCRYRASSRYDGVLPRMDDDLYSRTVVQYRRQRP